ncbi:MAG: glycosyl hydrolase [Chloroflexi bacterium]|nr:glycosyl hydrolase [Chloroflexota bacterium]
MLFVSQLRDRPLPTDAPDYFEPYWDTTTSPPGYLAAMFESSGSGRKFFDDNAWTGLDLVETYRSNGDSAALTRAVQIFNFTVSGWDDAPTDPDPGGVWWAQQNPNPRFAHRNTISTASSAELALRLYEATGRIDTHYLDWATRMYTWVDSYLRGSNGLYGDHVDLAGQVDPGQLTYNQGTMIGAAVLLYRSSGNGEYLARARATAETSLDVFGPDYNQQPAYNAVFFRNLLLLEADTRDGHYRAAMQAYADTVWDTLHDPATGLFNFANGRSRSVEPHRLLDQAAMLQIYALLALGPDAADVTI